jgi:hypothetical protein
MAQAKRRRTIEADVSVLAEPISPELVLVSPPEVARLARAQLNELPLPPIPLAVRVAQPRALELLAVYAFCLLITLVPLFLIVLVTPDRTF